MTPLSRVRRARSCAGRACIPATSWSGAGPATPGALAGLAQPRSRERPDLREAKIAALERERQRLELELAKARFVVDVQAKLPVEALRERGHRAEVNAMTDEAVAELVPVTGTQTACAAADAPQASYYRRHRKSLPPPRSAPAPHGLSRGRCLRPSANSPTSRSGYPPSPQTRSTSSPAALG